MKKMFGGIIKHGLEGAIKKQTKKWGGDLDKSLGKPSGLNSVIPEKREAAVSRLTGGLIDPGRGDNEEEPVSVKVIEEFVEEKELVLEEVKTIDVSAKSLSMALARYLLSSSIDKGERESILKLLDRESASNLDIAEDVLTYGNKEVNGQVKAWVLKHIDSSANVKDLRKIAIKYYADHTGETDVTLAIGTGGDSVLGLGTALFATGHPELSVEVASHLLGDVEM